MNCWGITDKGTVRKQNEDNMAYLVAPELDVAICVVCDGMGGAQAGDVASEIAVNTFVDYMTEAVKADKFEENLPVLITEAVSEANRAVYEKSQSSREYCGMGTTLAAVVVCGNKAVAANVGDSRVYYVTANGIKRITKDHSVVEEMIDRGDITREAARTHPSKNLITRVLGTENTVCCDLFGQMLNDGDFLLICSDGLSNVVTEQEMLFEVLHGENPDSCCKRLVEIVLSRGAPDNVTAVLLQR